MHASSSEDSEQGWLSALCLIDMEGPSNIYRSQSSESAGFAYSNHYKCVILQKSVLRPSKNRAPSGVQTDFKAFKRRQDHEVAPAKILEVFKVGSLAPPPDATAFLK